MEHAHKFRIYTPTGPAKNLEVRPHPANMAEPTDQNFIGSTALVSPRLLTKESVTEFANCPLTAPKVATFTRRFGPLWEALPDGSFAFLLSEWAGSQRQYQRTWEHFLGVELSERVLARTNVPEIEALREAKAPLEEILIGGGGSFRRFESGLGFVAPNLFGALVIELFALGQTGMLRRCANPTCKFLPYFIAVHGRQQFCCQICSEWGQAQGKKRWWEDRGDAWRKNRASAVKVPAVAKKKSSTEKANKTHGSQKAR
jgi:hypothetical protein